MSTPGLSHLISAPSKRTLFIPESMVDKLEQKGSNRDVKEGRATIFAEEMNHATREIYNMQLEEEDNHSMKQKEKNPPRGLSEREAVPEDFKRNQAERSYPNDMRSAEANKPGQYRHDRSNRHRHRQSQSYEDQGKHTSSIPQNGREDWNSYASHYTASLWSRPSVDKPQESPSSVYDPSHDIQVGSIVQVPSTGGNIAIYGIVRWFGTIPKCAEFVAGIELVM